MKRFGRLENRRERREENTLLQREELRPKASRSSTRYSQNVSRSRNSRTSRRIRNLQCSATTILVARTLNICQELRNRVQDMPVGLCNLSHDRGTYQEKVFQV